MGFVRADRKLIYLNVFPASFLESEKEVCQEIREVEAKEFCEPDHWRHAAILVCDGGDDFWGLEYDPEGDATILERREPSGSRGSHAHPQLHRRPDEHRASVGRRRGLRLAASTVTVVPARCPGDRLPDFLRPASGVLYVFRASRRRRSSCSRSGFQYATSRRRSASSSSRSPRSRAPFARFSAFANGGMPARLQEGSGAAPEEVSLKEE